MRETHSDSGNAIAAWSREIARRKYEGKCEAGT
jgi:hypothetical protein